MVSNHWTDFVMLWASRELGPKQILRIAEQDYGPNYTNYLKRKVFQNEQLSFKYNLQAYVY